MRSRNPYIRIEIDESGNVKVDAINYVGSACEEAWKLIQEELEKLGVNAKVNVRKKREYYIATTSKSRVRHRL